MHQFASFLLRPSWHLLLHAFQCYIRQSQKRRRAPLTILLAVVLGPQCDSVIILMLDPCARRLKKVQGETKYAEELSAYAVLTVICRYERQPHMFYFSI